MPAQLQLRYRLWFVRPVPSAVAVVALATTATAQSLDWLRAQPNDAPSARAGHALAADTTRGNAILFGGADPVTGTLADTWSWAGIDWARRQPMTSPPARRDHAMAYDAARQRIVLFGGADGTGADLADTWEWNGTDWVAVAAAGPAARHGHAMAYDAARQRVVLFGGEAGGALFADTWLWNGSGWTVMPPQPGGPVARTGHALAYDAARQRVVLFGGAPLVGVLADTWRWDGVAWLPAFSANVPPARRDHAMAYDAANARVLLFGGRDPQTRDDAWRWDGLDWAPLAPQNRVPAPRAEHAMAYLDAERQVVMFGGDNAASLPDTWLVAPAAIAYGTGCGMPPLGFVPGPVPLQVGQSTTATIVDAPTQAAAIAVGLSREFFGAFPLPLTLAGIGMQGCLLLQSAEILGIGAVPVTATTLSATLTLPYAPGLIGLHLYGQAYAFAPGLNPAGLAASNGIDWPVGYPGGTAATIEEGFDTSAQLDVDGSAGEWLGGTGFFFAIGGDGRHGDFDVSIAVDTGEIVNGRRVYEIDCDHTVIPASHTTTGTPLVVTDGRFSFASMRVAADERLRFVGSSPARVTVAGSIQVFGDIESNGGSIATMPLATAFVGQPGARGGAGAGRGGAGGDRCLGVGPGTGQFDGHDGEDVRVLAGHAYAGAAVGTGGDGASLYPASGLNSAQQFAQNPPVGLMYCLSAGAGGGGGGYAQPGAIGQPIAVLISGMPAPNYTAYFGPPAAGGTAMQLFPFPPASGLLQSSQHFAIGGSGGGGSASNASLSLSLARAWAPGAGGGGGGGALLLRAGYLITSASGSRLEARGGRAADNLGPAAGPQTAPAGGGSGGTVLLQSGRYALLQGELDVRGGAGGTFDRTGGGGGPNGGTIRIEGGDGAAGYFRAEMPVAPALAWLGTTYPPAGPQNVGTLTERDDTVAVRSRFYGTGLGFAPDLQRYELEAIVDNVPVTFSDDPSIAVLAAGTGAPVRLLFQAGRIDLATGVAVPVGPWRPTVRSSPGQTGISVDGGNAFRFIAVYDRTLAFALLLDRLAVTYRD